MACRVQTSKFALKQMKGESILYVYTKDQNIQLDDTCIIYVHVLVLLQFT